MSRDRARPSLPSPPLRRRTRGLVAGHRVIAAVVLGAAAAGLPSPVIASSGGGRRITDAENTRTVYLVAAVLIALAVGLAVFTWWFWRSTRRDHEALAPLEVMGDRKFLASDTVARQVMLDVNRPVGAAPLAPGAPEPLVVPIDTDTDEEAGTDGDAPPATVVLAAVGDEGEVAPTGAESPAAGDAGSTTDVAADAVATDAPAATGDEPAGVDEPAPAPDASDVVAQSADVDQDPAVTTPDAAPVDADATMAIDVTEPAGETASVVEPAPGPEPTADTEPAAPMTRANGSTPAAVPIDPGLHVPAADEEPVQPLSLAELVALHPHTPIGFDDDELASTPSTGIPVIESAEAWVERQLSRTSTPAGGGDGATTDGPEPADADPDEQQPAAVRGAE